MRGGLQAAEITFRTDAAAESIQAISENVPEMRVCAGTVLTLEQAQKAVSAGAQAIISPGTNPEIVTWCLEMGLPVIPGCATPSEVETCLRLGLTTVKLFPAEVVGGVAMLKALSGPYSQVFVHAYGRHQPAKRFRLSADEKCHRLRWQLDCRLEICWLPVIMKKLPAGQRKRTRW